MSVAFLGTGLLGSSFVHALLARGETVRVWNRTRAKAEALAAGGAIVCDSPADAARDATRVHLCLSDDAAVDDVLAKLHASDAVARDTWVVDHTTTSPRGAARRAAAARTEGRRFAHAPVFMSPAMARDAKGLMLLSGPPLAHDALRPILAPMTGELVYLGERDDLAASYKLFGNAMIITVAGGLADVFAMGRENGIAPEAALSLFSKLNIAAGLTARGTKMAQGDFTASFELTMARKDVRLMLDAAGERPLAVLPSLAKRMDELMAAGFGAADVGVLARDDEPRAAGRVLDRLTSTHRRIEARLAELVQAASSGDLSVVDETIAFYERGIARHEDDEERSLFPPLLASAEARPIVTRLADEHRAQTATWERLKRAASGDATKDTLVEIARELEESYRVHVRVEEDDLFPLAARLLDDAAFRRMETEVEARRGGGGGGGRGRRG